MKTTSRNFSITRTGLIGMPLMAATLLASQVGWAQLPKEPGNVIFFRGGYTELIENRTSGSFVDTHDTLGLGSLLDIPANSGEKGWYVGAGFDFLLTPDVWGMMPNTGVLAELGLEWKKYDSENTTLVVPTFECAALQAVVRGAGGGNPALTGGDVANCIVRGDIELSMLTISASPKIKFLEGSRIRPWIIPAGLDFHVISPPSDAATYLDLGVQFAAGVEFELIKGIKLGADARYHYTAGFTDPKPSFQFDTGATGVSPITFNQDPNIDNWVVGGYLGIGF